MSQKNAEKTATSHRRHHKESGQNWKLWTIRLLAVVAIAVSSYLAVVTFNNSGPAGCGDAATSMGCDEVLGTRWSSWFSIPVSVFAVVNYLLLFYYSFQVTRHRSARTPFRLFGFTAGLAAVWFLFLQFFVLEKFCPYCIAVHICGLAISGLILACGSFSRSHFNESGFQWALKPLAYAFVAMLVLIGGQFAYAPPEMLVADLSDQHAEPANDDTGAGVGSEISRDSADSLGKGSETIQPGRVADLSPRDTGPIDQQQPPPGQSGESSDPSKTGTTAGNEMSSNASDSRQHVATPADANPQPVPSPVNANTGDAGNENRTETAPPVVAARRIERVGPGSVDVENSILIGDPDAEEIVVEMVDYTCPKCRKAHRQLERFKKVSAEPFATLLVLVPINADCNPHISKTHHKNVQACNYTKLAMLVWDLNRDAFPAFHQWMMQDETPPGIESAKSYVAKILPDANIDQLMSRPDLSDRIRTNTDLYFQTGTGKLPRFYINEHSIVGVPSNERQMFSALQNLLARQ